jgi:hypothetical protein
MPKAISNEKEVIQEGAQEEVLPKIEIPKPVDKKTKEQEESDKQFELSDIPEKPAKKISKKEMVVEKEDFDPFKRNLNLDKDIMLFLTLFASSEHSILIEKLKENPTLDISNFKEQTDDGIILYEQKD